MNNIAGINYDENSPGFRKIRISPHFPENMDWAKGSYKSVAGEIFTEWKRTVGGKIKLTVKIPLGATAELVVNGESRELTAGLHILEI